MGENSDLWGFTVVQLRSMNKDKGLKITGLRKSELVQQLEKHTAAASAVPASPLHSR